MPKKVTTKPKKPEPDPLDNMTDDELQNALEACNALLDFFQNSSEEQINKWRS